MGIQLLPEEPRMFSLLSSLIAADSEELELFAWGKWGSPLGFLMGGQALDRLPSKVVDVLCLSVCKRHLDKALNNMF